MNQSELLNLSMQRILKALGYDPNAQGPEMDQYIKTLLFGLLLAVLGVLSGRIYLAPYVLLALIPFQPEMKRLHYVWSAALCVMGLIMPISLADNGIAIIVCGVALGLRVRAVVKELKADTFARRVELACIGNAELSIAALAKRESERLYNGKTAAWRVNRLIPAAVALVLVCLTVVTIINDETSGTNYTSLSHQYRYAKDYGDKQRPQVQLADETKSELFYEEVEGGVAVSCWKRGDQDDTVVIIPETWEDKPVVAISKNAFSYTKVTSVTIPDSVTHIGDGAFAYCEALTEVQLPQGLKELGAGAFSNCKSITSIAIPDSVMVIHETAFRECSELKTVTLPKDLTSLHARTFAACTALEKIDIPASVTSIGASCFEDCTALKKLEIPAGVTQIQAYAFQNCALIEQIKLPEGLTELHAQTFANCTGLQEIDIPASVKRLGAGCFEGCRQLKRIELPEQMNEIGANCFQHCEELRSIKLPEGLEKVKSYCFANSGLEEITIPEGVTKISSHAFYRCKSLVRASCPKTLRVIGSSAFRDDPALETVRVYIRTSIDERAFKDSRRVLQEICLMIF